MDEDKMRGLMIDHIDGKLGQELSNYVENHINKNPDAKKEYDQMKSLLSVFEMEEELDVPGNGKADFLLMLEEQKMAPDQKSNGDEKVISIFNTHKNVWRVAAAVLLLFVGYWGGSLIDGNSSEMEALRLEMQETKELVMLSMMKENSASARMKGVMASYEIKVADDEVLTVLIQTMNHDDNINVRVAAVEALGIFSDNEKARDALINSIVTQEYPAVQLKLIALMVQLEERRAVEPLQEIIRNDKVISVVKDEAQYGLFKLL